jgi:hypothetical protein
MEYFIVFYPLFSVFKQKTRDIGKHGDGNPLLRAITFLMTAKALLSTLRKIHVTTPVA